MDYKYFNFPFYHIDQDSLINSDLNSKALKPYLIVLEELDNTSDNLAFLTKIFTALKLNLQDDCTIFILKNDKSCQLSSLLLLEQNYHIFIFGISAKRLHLQINTLTYTAIQIQNMHLLFAHPLRQISEKVALKKQLWSVLQTINIEKPAE